MRDTKTKIKIASILFALICASCASSYQDRLDALSQPEEEPTREEQPAQEADGISHDDIVLSGACIVSADCATTQHCELGRCVADCGPEDPCEEDLFCSQRGRCVSDQNYIDVDAPVTAEAPVSWSIDKRVVTLDTGENGGSFNVSVSGGGALKYRVQVEPEESSSAVTVSEMKGVIASGGTKALNVSVDRSSFEDGDHMVSVNVVSDGGQKNVIYEFSNGFDGRYAGFVEYSNPGLGRVPLIVDIKIAENGDVLGRTVEAGSLLFPEERTLSGLYSRADGKIFFSTVDVVDAGPGRDPFGGRAILREVSFVGDVSEKGVIKGEVEEMISRLLPNDVSVTGNFYLTRTDNDVPDISVKTPTIPSYTPPVVAYTWGSPALPVSTTCNTTNFKFNMIYCSGAMRANAFKLGDNFVGNDVAGDDIVDFGIVEECQADLNKSGTGSCVDTDYFTYLRINQQAYLSSSLASNEEYAEYFDDLNGVQRLYALIGNDKLVEAYRTSIHDISSPLTQELARLEESLDSYADAEGAFFDWINIGIVVSASTDVVSSNDYELFRVPLQYIRASHSALKRIASLTMRKSFSSSSVKAEMRGRVQGYARVIFLEGIALARLISMHGGSFGHELAQIADELRSISLTASNLEAELNPLGFTLDYVPFIYDPADLQNATNFHQLVSMAQPVAASAVQKAETAESSAQLLEVRTDDIEQSILDIENRYREILLEYCGVTEIDELNECGLIGGNLAMAYNEIEQQYFEIEKRHQSMMDLGEMVKIKKDLSVIINGIQGRTLRFVESNGATLEALDIAEGEIKAAMLSSGGLFGSIGGFFSGVSSIATGVASGMLGMTEDKNGKSQMSLGGAMGLVGGISGGVSSLTNAALSSVAAANSASMSKRMARVAAKKRHMQNLQSLRAQEENMEISAAQAVADVKMLLVNMAQLNIDREMANLRLEEKVIAAKNMLATVDYHMHQREVLLSQALESVNNPLSNLSFRLKRDHSVLLAANEFEKALADVYLAARGLEHELNVELPQIESQLFQANSAQQLNDFLTCLDGWYNDYAIAFGSPHEEVMQLSLREDVLGFTESVKDEVTGEIIYPQEIFRRVLFNPKHIRQSGRIEFPFMTSIMGGNKQFSTLACNDRIKSIRVQLVGDFLGDNEATVMLRQEGDSYLRDCASDPDVENDILTTYHLDSRTAQVQAGVNSFGLAPPNYELTGRSVASDRWVLVIPTGDEAPNNADVDFLSIDDVIIEITHTARTLNSGAPADVFGQCNI